ncbi:alpha-E domain-containing protein [Ruficoccus sp. ZRK36]|uniref:alpha-E domain-containing protein n=1 Tax=Ruficoccus sp. ZRK36 TaxID=2866311 RepID=UPI001C736273|nr:alpha-E domain-containing protein [Ruficoccus sp. ZRK36]QYY37198.1 alpha-E domain-containing protein [Ruficoccus sp. ZRK36]
MLSRVADSIYWMARYIERAENIARLVEVNLQLLLDFQDVDDNKLKEHWDPLIRSTGDEERFYSKYSKATSESVLEFLTFELENPNSVLSCVFNARENARMVRDQITFEMWETLNKLYLFLKSGRARQLFEADVHEFYQQIKEHSHLFQGLALATVSRDEGYDFLQVGSYIERADKTTRILDIKYHMLLPSVTDVGGAVDVTQWTAVLRSASAYEAYHQLYVADVNPAKIAEFLIFSETFPRSIRFCVQMLNECLHRISGCPLANYSNEAERLCGRLLSELNYGSVEEVFQEGLHEYLDRIQDRLNEIGGSTYKAYMFLPPVDMAGEIQVQQQQQQ